MPDCVVPFDSAMIRVAARGCSRSILFPDDINQLSVTPGDPVSAMVDPEVAILLGPTWV